MIVQQIHQNVLIMVYVHLMEIVYVTYIIMAISVKKALN